MGFKIGLEKERFLLCHEGVPMVIPSGLPADSEGLQLEFRGEPHHDATHAVYSLLADEHKVLIRVHKEMEKQEIEKYTVGEMPVIKVPRDIKLKARRQYNKGILSYENLYGHKRHAVAQSESTAGIHISVTNETTIKKQTVNEPWDFVKFIRHMDEAFKEEIKDAKRRPGFYEIKSDGRIEYRSLPCNVSVNKLIDVLSKYNFYK